jgi:hypothetical protein
MRKAGLQAREARVPGGETKDFVDFLRSCTPSSPDQVQPPVLSHRLSGTSSLNAASLATTTTTRKNLVAREPDVRSGASDDLIDFLRRGPPQAGNGRTPAAAAASAIPKPSGSPVPRSLVSRPSVTDSFASNTPLMTRDKPLPKAKGSALAPGPPQIKRKTHRNKDPYAIDSDDEDTDGDLTALPSAQNNSDGPESLADFLRSTSPSASSRANGHAGPGTAASSREPLNFRAPVNRRNGDVNRQVPGPTGASSGTSNSLANRPSYPRLTGGPSSMTSSISSLNRKKMEARPAGATRGFGGHGYYHSTNDLADYLRTSGPSGEGMNGGANGIPIGIAGTLRSSVGSIATGGRGTPSGDSIMRKSESARKRLWGRKAVQA